MGFEPRRDRWPLGHQDTSFKHEKGLYIKNVPLEMFAQRTSFI